MSATSINFYQTSIRHKPVTTGFVRIKLQTPATADTITKPQKTIYKYLQQKAGYWLTALLSNISDQLFERQMD